MSLIIIIALSVVFIIGGPFIGHLATKSSEKDAKEMDKLKNK